MLWVVLGPTLLDVKSVTLQYHPSAVREVLQQPLVAPAEGNDGLSSCPAVEPQTAGCGSFEPSRETSVTSSTGLHVDSTAAWVYLLQSTAPDHQNAASAELKRRALSSKQAVLDIGLEGGIPVCLALVDSTTATMEVKERAIWLLSQLVSGSWKDGASTGGFLICSQGA